MRVLGKGSLYDSLAESIAVELPSSLSYRLTRPVEMETAAHIATESPLYLGLDVSNGCRERKLKTRSCGNRL